MGDVIRTVKVKLDVPDERCDDLHQTKEQFLHCANTTAAWAWRYPDEHCVTSKQQAENALYERLRDETALTANLVQKGIRRAIEATKSGVARLKKGETTSQPQFDAWSVVYEEAQEKWGTETDSDADEDEEVVEREFTLEVNGKRFEVELEERGAQPIQVGDVDLEDGADGPQRPQGGGDSGGGGGSSADGQEVTAEMQGTILSVEVDEGDEVESGDVLCVLEAMKMENDIVAERGGTINEIAVGEGDSVDMGDLLFVIA